MSKERIKIMLILVVFFSTCPLLLAQIQIDWQQAYGSFYLDEAKGAVETDDGYMILGYYNDDQPPTGMMNCSSDHGAWLIKISKTGHLIWQRCYDIAPDNIFQVKNLNGEKEYYIVGGWDCQDAINMKTIKIDQNGNEIWNCCVGNEHGHPYYSRGFPTSDGGVLRSAPYFCTGGDVTQFWGGVSDGWLVKLDNNGNLQWELSLGTEGDEYIEAITQTKNENIIIGLWSVECGAHGNVGCDPYRRYTPILTSLSPYGEIDWEACYGGSMPGDQLSQIVELDDGYLLAGVTTSEDGDLEGAGYHYGTYNNYPNGHRFCDIWLLRIDLDRNVVWSKCYGGSKNDFISKVFQTDDKGFIVFGTTYSNDGDVASASHIDLQYPNEGAAWIFRTDANGNLLWERCLGSGQLGRTGIADVIRHNDREYTLVGRMVCPSTNNGIAGDINCSNCRVLYNPDPTIPNSNYWVAHITDTVDYTTLQVPERPMQKEEAEVEVYPSPANKTVCVALPHEAYATELELFNMKGQKVAHKVFSGKSSWLEMEELPPGVYILKIRNAECCVTRKVLKD